MILKYITGCCCTVKISIILLTECFFPTNEPAADAAGGAEKKPKVEVTEDELREHVQNDTLAKLTVPVLKEACKQFGVRTTGTKKQELIDALIAKLGP